MATRKRHFIIDAFIESMNAHGFTRDMAWEEEDRRTITAFYRDIGGLNQKISLEKRGDTWETIVHTDAIGLHGFSDLGALVTAGKGLCGPHFYTNARSYFSTGGNNEKESTIFLRILEENFLFPFETFNSAEDLASIFPSDINISAISKGRRRHDYGYRYYPSPKQCFMRMISTNLYLANLELAKAQATTLLDHLRDLPYDTAHDQSLARGVLKINSIKHEYPPIRWENPSEDSNFDEFEPIMV